MNKLSGNELLMWAIIDGDFESVKKICELKDVDIDEEVRSRCPVHYAADWGHYEILEHLLSKGADANVADKDGVTPMYLASMRGFTKCVELLRNYDIVPNQVN